MSPIEHPSASFGFEGLVADKVAWPNSIALFPHGSGQRLPTAILVNKPPHSLKNAVPSSIEDVPLAP
jgi:hypothetical protein